MSTKTTITPIVVVAYNRPDCLLRILHSLAQADYAHFKNIPLIVSIDFSEDNAEVIAVAEKFVWNYGEKKVSYHNSSLGLRKHIIECANYSIKYGSVIIFEDDLFVAPTFYSYATEALEFSANKAYIGGISLYNHQLNAQTHKNFSPIEDGYDNWYFQFAASWGQCWTKSQWEGFIQWYDNNQFIETKPTIPSNVIFWSEKSWLKFYVAYLIETNKYFLYPKVALSSNFSEAGTHNFSGTTAFQVNLRYKIQSKFNFSCLEESKSVYDAFYENRKLTEHLDINNEACCVNLYAFKPTPSNVRYLLTTKKLHYAIIKSFGKSLKPVDLNIILNIPGKDIFLYDLSQPKNNMFSNNRYNELTYNYKIVTLKDAAYLFFKITLIRLGNLRRKLF